MLAGFKSPWNETLPGKLSVLWEQLNDKDTSKGNIIGKDAPRTGDIKSFL